MRPSSLLGGTVSRSDDLSLWVLSAPGAADSSCSVTGRLYKPGSHDLPLGWDSGLEQVEDGRDCPRTPGQKADLHLLSLLTLLTQPHWTAPLLSYLSRLAT